MERIEEAPVHCLELIDRGNTDIESCVEMYPQSKGELGDPLRLVPAIRSQAGQMTLPPETVRQIRERIRHAPEQPPEAAG